MDKAHFTAAVERYKDMVFRTALHTLASPQDADDTVQEVFLRLFQYQGTFDGEEHLRRWLLRVTVNRCRDLLKSPWRKRPEKYRTVLNLFYYEELSVREIGELLGVGDSTVTTRLARARRRLKERLGEDWQDE